MALSLYGRGALLAILIASGAPVRAEEAAADWPCVQRLVPAIAAAAIWAGPPVDQITSAPSPAVAALAGELAARRVPLADAEAQVATFAATLAPEQKDDQLTLLFGRTLAIIDRDRGEIIGGIRKYAQGQRALADKITGGNAAIAALASDAVLERDTLMAERDWDIRIYEDRQKSLTYLCDQPVLLERRAFGLARAIAAELG